MFRVLGQNISHFNIFHVATTKELKAFSMQTQTALGASISKNLKDFKHPTIQDVLSSSRLVKCKLFSSSNVIGYHEKPMIILDKDFFIGSEHSSLSYVFMCFPTQNSFVEGACLELIYFNSPLLEIVNTSNVQATSNHDVASYSQSKAMKGEVINIHVGLLQLLVTGKLVIGVKLVPIHEENTCIQSKLVYDEDTNMHEVISLVTLNEEPVQLSNNLHSILRMLKQL
jgi:hypothetical protein